MDREAWNEWLDDRGDDWVSFALVQIYCEDTSQTYDKETAGKRDFADTVDYDEVIGLIEQVEAQVREVYDGRVATLEGEREVILKRATDREEKYQKLQHWYEGFKLVAGWIWILRNELDCTGRLDKHVEIGSRGTLVEDAESLYDVAGPHFALRPVQDGYRLEPTSRTLRENDLPADPNIYPFQFLSLPRDATVENAETVTRHHLQRIDSMLYTALRQCMYFDALEEVYDNLISRHLEGQNMPWEEAQEAVRTATYNDSRPAIWEQNAAMMYAYFSNHGAPDKLKDVDDVIEDQALLDSFSYEHTWKKLKSQGWATSQGNIQALTEALERWAEHFESKYGKEKADRAAGPFNWPLHNG